jgi:transcriptional regulator with XRE-family HTH domain
VNKPVKLPEIRKEEFTKARESLGLSTKDLSGMACLSVRQIEQLENGGISSYYGDQVKFTAAKKVAALLKLTPEEAFDFGDLIQPIIKAPESEVKLQGETKTSAIEKKVAIPIVEKVAESKPENIGTKKVSESVVDYSVKSKAQANPKKKFFLLLAIVAALIFAVVNLRPMFFPEPVKEEVVIIQAVPSEPAPAPEPVADAKPAAALVPEPSPALVLPECPPADASALNYKPDAPKKAGDLVYLQSKTAQTVCVVDASGKTQNKTLEPGVGVSVYGKPPFKVLTGGLNQVDLYFQGAKVRIGSTASKTIILEPAEIIQPAAPLPSTDSQLR